MRQTNLDMLVNIRCAKARAEIANVLPSSGIHDDSSRRR
jgi:hypothetical protein